MILLNGMVLQLYPHWLHNATKYWLDGSAWQFPDYESDPKHWPIDKLRPILSDRAQLFVRVYNLFDNVQNTIPFRFTSGDRQ